MTEPKNIVPDLAKLSRLKLTAAEEAAYSAQIPAILDYVNQLQQVAGPTPQSEPVAGEALRPDQVHDRGVADDILAQAPRRVDRFWQVPPVK